METCPVYEQGNAAKRFYFGKEMVACRVDPEYCPLKNSQNIEYGGEIIGTICKSYGLIENFWQHPSFTLRVKIDNTKLEFKVNQKRELPPELL
jgi:hypothetical protein